MSEKVIDYTVSVKDKTVEFIVKSQISDVSEYLAKKSKFGKFSLKTCACVELGRDYVYLIGSSKAASSKKDTFVFSSSSAAFTYASNLSESLEEFSKFVLKTKKDAEDLKKAATAKKISAKPAVSNFEYSVTVDGKQVTLTIMKQTDEVTEFFGSERIYASGKIQSYSCVEIRNDSPFKVYVKGEDSDETPESDSYTYRSNSEALKVAAKITALFEEAQKKNPEIFFSAKEDPKFKLNLVTKFEPNRFYLDTHDGEIILAQSERKGYSLSKGLDACSRWASSDENWVLLNADWKTIAKTFKSIRQPSVLSEFKKLNALKTKQIWHL
jgi:hypothetical protein